MPDRLADLAALLPETVIEYRNPPPSVCGHELGVDLRLQRGETRDAITTVRIECGEVLRTEGPFPVLESCVRVRARNYLGERVSESRSIDDASGACMPLPEPGVSVALLAGVLWAIALARTRNGRPPP